MNILKEIKTEPVPRCHYGFQLIAKKLADQLREDIEKIKYSKVGKNNIKNIKQAKLAINEIETMVEASYGNFETNKCIDTAISLYNDQRPEKLRLDPSDYKIFANQLAYFQLCWIFTYLDPDTFENKNDYHFCIGVTKFFQAKTQCYYKKYYHCGDGYIWTLQKLLFAIDEALPALESFNGTATNPSKKHAQTLSGYLNFEDYLKSLYIQYDTASIYYPELMDPEWRSFYLTAHLHKKQQEMKNCAPHKHKAYINDIIEPILDDLMFLRNTHKLDQPSVARMALQCHIENLTNTTANYSKNKKAITVEIIEYLIILYEQSLGRKYKPN